MILSRPKPGCYGRNPSHEPDMSQPPPSDILHANYGRIFRHPNGIVYLYLADHFSLKIGDAKQIVNDVRNLDNSGRARLIVVQGSHNDLSFEAQHHLGTVQGVTHLALVVRSKVQADVAQLFVSLLQLFRSPYELRIFHLLEQAEEWLLSVTP